MAVSLKFKLFFFQYRVSIGIGLKDMTTRDFLIFSCKNLSPPFLFYVLLLLCTLVPGLLVVYTYTRLLIVLFFDYRKEKESYSENVLVRTCVRFSSFDSPTSHPVPDPHHALE